MIYKLLADVTVLVHMVFIIFVGLGGLLCFRWPKVSWLHIPAFLWGAGISLFGWICPLTHLEKYFRRMGEGAGFEGGFIDHYIVPVIYPEMLIMDFPRSGFIAIGLLTIVVNIIIYTQVIRIWRK